MTAELTASDYAFLMILKAEDRQISNTEMSELYDVRLVGPEYARLKKAGLVETEKKGSTYHHVLAPRGEKLLSDLLTIGDDHTPATKRRAPAEKILWAALVARHNEGRTPRSPAPASRDLGVRIREAYGKLAGTPGDWVSLTALRPLIDGVPKARLDDALIALLDEPGVRLEPEPFGHRVGAEERAAAIHYGGEDLHKLAIGPR